MKILHIASYYIRATKTGGPALVVRHLAQALQCEGHTNKVVTTTGNLDEEIDLSFRGDLCETIEDGIPTIYLRRKKSILPATYYYAPNLQDWVSKNLSDYEVVILHGVWTYFSWMGAIACQKRNIPYVYFIHGSFDPWAMKHHGMKKIPYWHLIEKPNLKKASGVIVLSDDEATQVRNLGIDKPIIHAKNGILFPVPRVLDAVTVLKNQIPELDNHPFVCSISRLHPKKGLEVLIKAWENIAEIYPAWRLVIAGPDEGGYLTTLKFLTQQLALDHSVIFTGPVQGEYKTALLEKASIFVLPSFSEGVPGSVIEALSYSLPVLITPGCHLPEVDQAKAGLIVEPEIQDVSRGLKALMSNEGLRQEMGINAEKLARDQFDEIKVATNLVTFLNRIVIQ